MAVFLWDDECRGVVSDFLIEYSIPKPEPHFANCQA